MTIFCTLFQKVWHDVMYTVDECLWSLLKAFFHTATRVQIVRLHLNFYLVEKYCTYRQDERTNMILNSSRRLIHNNWLMHIYCRSRNKRPYFNKRPPPYPIKTTLQKFLLSADPLSLGVSGTSMYIKWSGQAWKFPSQSRFPPTDVRWNMRLTQTIPTPASASESIWQKIFGYRNHTVLEQQTITPLSFSHFLLFTCHRL